MQKVITKEQRKKLASLIKQVRSANKKAYALAKQLEKMEEDIWGCSHNSLDVDEVIEDIDYAFKSDKTPMSISEYIEAMNKFTRQ